MSIVQVGETNEYPLEFIETQGNAEDICSHCLPDCQLTTYSTRHTSIQFRRVSRNNFGQSSPKNLILTSCLSQMSGHWHPSRMCKLKRHIKVLTGFCKTFQEMWLEKLEPEPFLHALHFPSWRSSSEVATFRSGISLSLLIFQLYKRWRFFAGHLQWCWISEQPDLWNREQPDATRISDG